MLYYIVPVPHTAGCLAHEMGLPVHIVCAVNSNDVVARFIRTGQYMMAASVHASLAPAMDVQVGCPSTFPCSYSGCLFVMMSE